MKKFLTLELLNKLCMEIQQEDIKKGEILFYEGDIGKKFYMILEGSVNILIQK
jgi:CRP-like cAMP-binding protein